MQQIIRHVLPSGLLTVGLLLGNLLGSVEGAAFPLGDLLDGGSFTQGDKQFDNFFADSLDPTSSVEGITDNNEQHGIVISGTTSDAEGEMFTSFLDFSVTVLDTGFNIHGVTSTFSFEGNFLPVPGGFLNVQSSFFCRFGSFSGPGESKSGDGDGVGLYSPTHHSESNQLTYSESRCSTTLRLVDLHGKGSPLCLLSRNPDNLRANTCGRS